MPTPAEKQLHSFDLFLGQVIAPSATLARLPLHATAFQSIDPVPYTQAQTARFKPVRPGFEWGPSWSTCWYKLSLPSQATPSDAIAANAFRSHPVHLRFSTHTEALLWLDGIPHHGFDTNRDLALLPAEIAAAFTGPASRNGRPRTRRNSSRQSAPHLLIEAACNHHFGAMTSATDHPESQRRWASAKPGRFAYAELVVLDDTVVQLQRAWRLAVDLAKELLPPPPPNTTHSAIFWQNHPWQIGRCEELIAVLTRAWQSLDIANIPATAPAALRILQAALARTPAASATLCHAVGHAHIDTAWLWPLRETRRKCLRTFSNVLALMDEFPSFRFLCSQAQQYAFVEEDSPELFTQMKRRVAQGRWEPGGAMWIEPDCNVPSAESLIRQILHGTRYFTSRFKDRAPQTFLYLPDTFGFPAHLPQIARLAGLRTFITNKIAWNDTNPFPHTTFLWRGLDGSDLLTHFTPGNDYNATNSPVELRRGETNHRTKQIPALLAPVKRTAAPIQTGARWLQPFGFGDGGGGPTAQMIHNALAGGSCDGLPRVQLTRADAFCDALHADVAAAAKLGIETPLWNGELYLELHRGTLTTQAWLKQAMRRTENQLRTAEFLAVARFAGRKSSADGRELARTRDELDAACKLVLLNQFHDILPGSSTNWVYKDSRRQMAQVRETLDKQIASHTAALAAQLARSSASPDTHLLVNPSSTEGETVVDINGRPGLVAVEPLTIQSVAPRFTLRDGLPPATINVDDRRKVATIANGALSATIDRFGRVTSLRVVAPAAPELVGDSPLNALVLYEDHPRLWEAWDIDETAAIKPSPALAEPTKWKFVERHPLRVSLEITRPLGLRSTITQTFILTATSSRLDIRTRIDWREERRLLRALFPTSISARSAAFDTGCGFIERPTHRNTSHEQAAFEVPAHRFVDLSSPGRGVAILNDSKYGHSCHGQTIGLTLLRSPRFPDPEADIGVHEFTYSIMPHIGDRTMGVHHQAEQLNRPIHIVPLAIAAAPRRNASVSVLAAPGIAPVTISTVAPADTEIMALKFAEAGKRVILRIHERNGGHGSASITWNIPVKSVDSVDLLEAPLPLPGLRWNPSKRTSTCPLRPFQIITLAATI